jgi:hypothetical protein
MNQRIIQRTKGPLGKHSIVGCHSAPEENPMKTGLLGQASLLMLTGMLLLSGASSSQAQSTITLPPGCKLPFSDIAPATDPFVKCGNCGVVSAVAKGPTIAAKAEESNAKNNFCADTTNRTVVDFEILRQMQAKPVDKSTLGDRHLLHGFFQLPSGTSIGEGSVVRLKAWILNAHVSDCPTGESVNCSLAGFVNNCIHIPLLDPEVAMGRSQDECTSVTAEMSPHFRPAAWSQIDLKAPVSNVVRVTGPLFSTPATKLVGLLTTKLKATAPLSELFVGNPSRLPVRSVRQHRPQSVRRDQR